MKTEIKTSVLIVGAGPVGTTMAMDLKRRGVDVLVVERNNFEQEPWMARCNTVAARTMEIWRSLGLAKKVRAAGLPDDYPTDVMWTTRANGFEIARLPLSSRNTRFSDMSVADAGWPTAEPVHRVSQLLIDPILHQHASSDMGVQFIGGSEVTGYRETGSGVIANIMPVNGDPAYEIHCDYLIGCDGGRSTIRREMGVEFIGDDEIYRARATLIRAPWMLDHLKTPKAWMTWYLGPGTLGGMIAVNGKDLWLVHVNLPYGEKDFSAVDLHASIRDELDLPPELQYDVLHQQDWIARRRIAERYRLGRVFLCGDAAHIWAPWAGHGMNTGIVDAVSLSWQLAAVIQGWGSVSMLDCYELERHEVDKQISTLVMNKCTEYVRDNMKNRVPAAVDLDDEQGRQVRAAIGNKLLEVNRPQFGHIGLNFGYYYDKSPIIAYDSEAAPGYDMGSYTPSTVPGCRLPHFFIDGKTSLYDRLGLWYTLLRFDAGVNIEALLAAAKKLGVPIAVLDLENPDAALYQHKLVLARPDQHVAWRGDALPAQPETLIKLISGSYVGNLVRTRTES